MPSILLQHLFSIAWIRLSRSAINVGLSQSSILRSIFSQEKTLPVNAFKLILLFSLLPFLYQEVGNLSVILFAQAMSREMFGSLT